MSPLMMNGSDGAPHYTTVLKRADELDELVDAVKGLIVPFVRAADEAAPAKAKGCLATGADGSLQNTLVNSLSPETLVARMKFALPIEGQGKDGLLDMVHRVLHYSVNTWDQGYMDKLCASTNAVGVVSEMVLAALNTNSHVYQVSPALTVVEKLTARTFASLFGLVGPHAGGITCPGGSGSNLTSLTIARNSLYPEVKSGGNSSYNFAIFTSAHSHYSIQKAAMVCGLGADNVVKVPVDVEGRMEVAALRSLVLQSKARGQTPLYVNATAGTTVLGSYDPLRAISAVCREFGMWFHVDGSFGGAAIFSSAQKHKMDGSELADSLTVNPHKVLNTPTTCSFLLTKDLRRFRRANNTPAGYLFHGEDDDDAEVWDLADLTLQCGRRPDALKLALSWTYYGAHGFEIMIDHAFAMAAHLAALIDRSPDFELVSSNPPPCLQVCFYYTPGGRVAESDAQNTLWTRNMVRRLVQHGFMIDHAPGPRGNFFRVALNCQTLIGTVNGLVEGLKQVGKETVV